MVSDVFLSCLCFTCWQVFVDCHVLYELDKSDGFEDLHVLSYVMMCMHVMVRHDVHDI